MWLLALRWWIMVFTRWILALSCLLLVADPARAEPPEGRFWVGACTHFCQGKGLVEQNLESIRQAGIDSIRDEVVWSAIEREKGRLEMPERFDTYVRRAAAEGLDVLLILNYANRFYDDGDRPRSPEAIEGFCRYAEFVVEYFGSDVRRYEAWAVWSGDDRDRQVVFQSAHPERPLTIRQAGHAARIQSWGFRDWARRQPKHDDQLSLVVGHRPVLLGTDLSGVSVARVTRLEMAAPEHR